MVTAGVVGIGLVVLVVLLALLARANPGSADAARPLVARRPVARPPDRLQALRAWEADLLAASTGGRRGRARLARKLEPVVSATLRDSRGLAMEDPAARDLLGAEWDFLCGGAPPTSAPRLSVDQAVTALLDRLVTPSPRGGA